MTAKHSPLPWRFGGGQQMRVYSDTLHPDDDSKTVLHLLREAIQAAEGER